MSRRKKFSEHESVSVEVIVWHDASSRDREAPSLEPIVFRSVVMVLEETETELVAAFELRAVEDYLSSDNREDANTTNIPLVNIVERVKCGEVKVEMNQDKWREYVAKIRSITIGTETRTSEVLRVDTNGGGPSQPQE